MEKHITNGECFNTLLTTTYQVEAIPFNEAMCMGQIEAYPFSDVFVNNRVIALHTTKEIYLAKMQPFLTLLDHLSNYTEIYLWFDEDTFCMLNLLTLLTILEQHHYTGKLQLNIIDERQNQVTMKHSLPIQLGHYTKIYEEVLIYKKPYECHTNLASYLNKAIELYFDMYNEEGKLAKLIKEHAYLDTPKLLSYLLNHTHEYGLGDVQLLALIEQYTS